MALPVRRRERASVPPASDTPRTPTVWDPFADPAAMPAWDDPWAQLRALNQRVTRLLEEWSPVTADGEVATPLGELEEHDDAWLVRLELPGVRRDDVQVELDGRRLVVDAERKQTERKGLLRRSTRTTGRYHLESWLPGDVDADAVEATLDAGVLTVRLPKPEAERRKRRKITIS
jgi:HSP20 family protein